MSKKAKPLIVIALAIIAAAGIAMYLSGRSASTSTESGTGSTTAVAAGGGHIKGSPSAPVTLVEFGDYQCPSCRYYYPIVEELLKRYPDKVKLEFHHYPLIQMHPHAMAAAQAVEAAGDQGKYWEMHDMLYNRQQEWSTLLTPDAQFLTYAGQLGLDGNKFMQSYKSPDVQKRILEDVQRGVNVKVNGTPTFIINGRPLNPLPSGVDEFAAIVDSTLQANK